MGKKSVNILSIALIYCGGVFGAGFASGREIFTFFSCYKASGILASVFAGFLFSFFGYVVSNYAKKRNIKNAEEYFCHLFPRKVARIFSFAANVFLILSFSIMITGCGALFYETFGIPSVAGALISALICGLVIKNDVSGLEKFNFLATPVMLLGVVGLCLACARLSPTTLVETEGAVMPIVSAILYVSYNMVSATAVLISSAKIAKNAHQAAIGGALGGALVGVVLVMMSAVLAFHWEVAAKPLPFFSLVRDNFPKMGIICTVVLYFAMMTTATSSGVVVLDGVACGKNTKYTLLLCMFAVGLSFFSFSSLVQTVYSAFGFIGIVLIAGILAKSLRKQK